MTTHAWQKLFVVSDQDGITCTYVVRETEESISVTAHLDPRSSQALPIREMVNLVCAVLPHGLEKFQAFKLLRMVEEGIDDIEDRMAAQQQRELDEPPF